LSEEYYLLTTELSSRAQLSTLNRHPERSVSTPNRHPERSVSTPNRHPERSVSTPNRHPERSEAESKDLKRQIMLVKDEDNIYLTLLVTTSRIIQYVRQKQQVI